MKEVLRRRAHYWQALTVAALGAVLITIMLGGFKFLPPPTILLLQAEQFYSSYGYWIIFGAALLEGLLIFSWYFPGSMIVLLGAAFSADGTLYFPAAVLCGVSGFLVSFSFDYLCGYYGWRRIVDRFGIGGLFSRIEAPIGKYGPAILLLTYIHPYPGATAAMASGAVRTPYRLFLVYSLIALLVWGFFWGTLAYLLGRSFLINLGAS